MRKFLVIQTAFIGDVVLATAIIEKLHAHYPAAKIDFMLRKGNEGLLEGHPFISGLLVWDKRKNKISNLLKLTAAVRRTGYDAVINVQRFAATGFLTAFSNAGMKIGFNKNPFSFLFTHRVKHIIGNAEHPLHEVERNQLLIRQLTDATPARPRLYPSPGAERNVSGLKVKPYIVVAPASVWFTKQYPAAKWISFLDKIPHSIPVYLVGGPGDSAMAGQISAGSAHPSIHNVCGQYNFLESAALQRDALMNYVNDSAPMHFASAVNAPVTAVYCSTLPSFGFGPLSDRQFIVQAEEKLSCRPCGLHGKKACPESHFHCAYKIREEQLLETLKTG
ncbi:MAG: glycosyltransferase family 9 protein [Sphingobacteriales bacterium]|nr:glycosyltransferase family 9 protein [Sphingobacteriales bacterium]